MDGLHPGAHPVALARQLRPEPHPQPGLLLDLADRGRRRPLAAVELALGERPVVVLRPVHQQHRAGRVRGPRHPRRRRRGPIARGPAVDMGASLTSPARSRGPGVAAVPKPADRASPVSAWSLVLLAVAAVVGVRWWRECQRTDLERALAYAPPDSVRFSWTDWAGVRRELDSDVDASSSSGDVEELPLARVRRRPDLDVLDGGLGRRAAGAVRVLAGRRRLGAAQPGRQRVGGDDGPAGVARRGRAGGHASRTWATSGPSEPTGVWEGGEDLLAAIGGDLAAVRLPGARRGPRAAAGQRQRSRTSPRRVEAARRRRRARRDEGLAAVAGAVGEPLSAALYTGDQACRALRHVAGRPGRPGDRRRAGRRGRARSTR